ncbi:hypothetical protein FOA52_000889 [Chlamydomonas sp. UWO 241]|nr:hypothetical protein FOA52_000889 [Chlamydomonas sp. UWO 241]
MRDCASAASLAPLSACTELERLDMQECSSVTSLAPLSTCAHLKMLNMNYCTRVTSVEPLAACAELEELRIAQLAGQLQLSGLASLKAAMPRLRIV